MSKQIMQEEKEEIQETVFVDSALQCLLRISQIIGVAADEKQIRRAHIIGKAGMDLATLVRTAKEMGLKAHYVDYSNKKAKATFPLPAIGILENGCYIVILSRNSENTIVFDPYRDHQVSLPEETFIEQWSGKTILIAKRPSLVEEEETKFGLAWFIPVIMQYKKAFGKILLFSLILQIFGLVTPLFTQVIINKVLVHHSLSTLNILIVGVIAICIFEAWITGLRSCMLNHHISKVDVTLSAKIFHHVMALPIKFFEKYKVGEIVSRIRELDNIRGFIVGSAFTVILDSAFSLMYLGIMVMYSGYLTIVTLVALGLYIILNLILTPLFRRKLKEKSKLDTANQTFMIEAITGIQTVKSLAVEKYFIQKWDEMLSRYIKSVFVTANINNVGNNIAALIQQLSMIGILWVGVNQVMENQLSVGELIAFQMYSNSVVSPVLRLVDIWQRFQQTRVSVNRLGDIMSEKSEPVFDPDRTTLSTIRGEIILDRVTFRYREDTNEILNQINLKIEANTSIGIVGRSGSGKSTLTKIIQRLYVPETGRILIDGVDMAQVEPAWLRRQIGVVLQETYLFNGSIRDNIALAKLDASMDEIIKVAQIAGVDEFANELPNGYNTIVGERGATLSGGQKQRIAIARALLIDPRILIFDEATSALDNESENIIKENLGKMAVGRTLIMIAHRLTTIRDCDTIIFMEQGKIIEKGTHAELLALKGAYYDLYMLQEK
ncbi:peptidase domain-containing ABC transporter [Pelosinus sp. UFO1]|uniref:peptidase domain-containing ABC transporter n=1 Tax=Pelosinus sp. UFO1 TaxID=484770 RepID=UPI0004D18906|nr:type I secretion system permease/ATPase [Pelosinus sp. UFO1]AIF49743.1 type I secretion system ATPase [Pelosinus sp. UFO1]